MQMLINDRWRFTVGIFSKALMRHSYKEERNVNTNNTHTSFYLMKNITN